MVLRDAVRRVSSGSGNQKLGGYGGKLGLVWSF